MPKLTKYQAYIIRKLQDGIELYASLTMSPYKEEVTGQSVYHFSEPHVNAHEPVSISTILCLLDKGVIKCTNREVDISSGDFKHKCHRRYVELVQEGSATNAQDSKSE